MTHLNKTQTLQSLPPEWPDTLLTQIRTQIASKSSKLVVLDDDPTGTQTVYDIPVLTEWSVDVLATELAGNAPGFYILTNSRSLPLDAAQTLNEEIGRNLLAASQRTDTQFTVVSRSDSTLRGHYPGEVEALQNALGQRVDATLLIPYFLEGGRLTIHDVHYVAEGDALIPAAETPFAQDAAFGYRSSNLREWVVEKTGGAISADQIYSVTVADIREGGPDVVAGRLHDLPKDAVCIINSVTLRDQEVFVAGLLAAQAKGKQFIYRTAASFVQIRLGLETRPILTKTDLGISNDRAGGGLIVVGSYVPKTTSQLQALLDRKLATSIEISVNALLDDAQRGEEIIQVATKADLAIQDGQDVVLYTSRELVSGEDAKESLSIGEAISSGLVQIVRSISTRPKYLIAKGGITSSDVATKGLAVKRAIVWGQILPGVPVWRVGNESRFPGMPYVVFPGNVGDDQAVADVVEALRE